MINFLSSWAKGLGIAIIVVSILEMLLPDNKMKKYIRVVMGIYILFCTISPFIQEKNVVSLNNIDFENYVEKYSNTTEINQTSMDNRIEELYIEQLEKDISKKVSEKGYEVNKCKVDAKISDKEEETKINKIKLSIKKSESSKQDNKEEKTENKIVTEIQKIKTVNTTVNNNSKKDQNKNEVSKSDIQNIKKFLIEEYGVNEKCLEIN